MGLRHADFLDGIPLGPRASPGIRAVRAWAMAEKRRAGRGGSWTQSRSVNGSMTARTSETRLAGKPLSWACFLTRASSVAT